MRVGGVEFFSYIRPRVTLIFFTMVKLIRPNLMRARKQEAAAARVAAVRLGKLADAVALQSNQPKESTKASASKKSAKSNTKSK